MSDDLFRILALLSFLAGAAISIYFRSKADREGGRVSLNEEGLAISIALRLFGISLWTGIFAWLINPAWMGWARIDLPDWMRWLGLVLGVLSNLLAYWIFTNLANNVSPTVVTREKAHLVTSGPYQWVRHPLYSMGTIAYLGFALVSENWFIAVMSLLVFIVLVIRTPKEEARLIEKFGDEYRQYMQRTGRFMPKIF